MFNARMAAVAATAAFCIGAAEAAYIVDTGPAAAGAVQLSLNDQGISFQHLGATFNVGQDSSLDSVEGWISGVGNLLFELHQGASPTGALLFSSLVSVDDRFGSDWHGATGLDWDVLAGDYTLTVIAQQGFVGGMGTGVANPLGTEWFANPFTPNWASTTFDMGWRVGATAALPEPGSFGLAALGLLALGAGAARKRKA